MADTGAAASRWPDLQADLLRDISGRLRDPVDFVRFHAVCKPWRDAAPPSPPAFPPLLLTPSGSSRNPGPLLRSVFSNTLWRAYSDDSSCRHHKWLAGADGGGTWLLTGGEAPCLIHPLTGAATARLPRFPDEIACFIQYVPEGAILADGTIVLFVVDEFVKNGGVVLAAAVLRPGDAAWTAVVEPLVSYVDFYTRSTPALVNGEIVLADFPGQCAIILRVAGGMADVIQTKCDLEDPADGCVWNNPYSYILESRGELLYVSVVNSIGEEGQAGTLSVSLHALELGPEDGDRPRWVKRDGRNLADRVMFLGRPASFTVDAARLGGAVEAGCAYFIVKSTRLCWPVLLPEACLVHKYSFMDGSATVVAELKLPDGWEEMTFMWFMPQVVTIATTQEIRERLQTPNIVNNPAPTSITFHAEKPPRQFGPYFKIYVGNLPWKVDNNRLRQFFNQHGQVADATVVYNRETGRSRGFGFVTMASMEEPSEAITALNGQVLDGRVLRVSFAKERQQQEPYMPLLLFPQQQPIYWWWWW